MRHDEIKALCRPIAWNWRSGLSSKPGLPAAGGLIMVCAPPKVKGGWARRRIVVSGGCTTSARSALQRRPAVLLHVEQGNDLLFEAANRKAAAFLAVRLGATADITLECRPHAGCENRQVGQVVVDEQGQRQMAVIGEGCDAQPHTGHKRSERHCLE